MTSDAATLTDKAVRAHQSGDLAEAERLYEKVLARQPASFVPRHLLGIIRAQQGRNEEALELIGGALELDPKVAEVHLNYGNVLKALGRPAEALASFDRALALKPDFAGAFANRGIALRQLERPEEALASYDAALKLAPGTPSIWNNRGNVLLDLVRLEDALASFTRAIALKPDFADALFNRANTLKTLGRPKEALAGYGAALAARPDFADALFARADLLSHEKRFDAALTDYDRALALMPGNVEAMGNRAKALCEGGHIAEGFAAFSEAARHVYGAQDAPSGGRYKALLRGHVEPDLPHKLHHDAQQRAWWAQNGITPPPGNALFLASGQRLAGAAVQAQATDIDADWRAAKPQMVVIDDFLTPEALTALRHFCAGSAMWREVYDYGYLGALPEQGFAAPLLAQIAEEMAAAHPAIFQDHRLTYLWAIKYDSRYQGTYIHADEGAVNVNFWITPDEANLEPGHGGLIVWDIDAPPDWADNSINGDSAEQIQATKEMLLAAGAKPVTIPYRANRCVIFDSDLFHESDRITFKDGYLDRRINVTLVYGRRETM